MALGHSSCNIDVVYIYSGKDILVPLTSSMYVPGLSQNNNKFICDIGTGYYVEKNQKDTINFFERKIKYLTSNLEKLQKGLQDKQNVKENVLNVMQVKIQTQMMSGAGGSRPSQ
jgi:prefoldin alpha subunit